MDLDCHIRRLPSCSGLPVCSLEEEEEEKQSYLPFTFPSSTACTAPRAAKLVSCMQRQLSKKDADRYAI